METPPEAAGSKPATGGASRLSVRAVGHATGLGAAVAEITAARAPTWVCRVGVQEHFSRRCGSSASLLKEHGLDLEGVLAQVQGFLEQVHLELALPREEAVTIKPDLVAAAS